MSKILPKVVFFIALTFYFVFPRNANAQVTINEFVVDTSPEWIELYNSSASAEYLKSYWIDDDTNFSDDSGNRQKQSLSNLNTGNTTYPFADMGVFIFNNGGDYVVLFDAAGTIVDQYQYNSNPGAGVPIGRSPNGSGTFYILDSATKGASNANPVSTPAPSPAPTPDPTADPTSDPTTSPTKSPTPKPTLKPRSTRKPVAVKVSNDEDEVILGLRGELKEEEEVVEEEEEKKKVHWGAYVFIIIGIGFFGVAGYSFYSQKKKSSEGNGKDNNQKPKEKLVKPF